MSKLYVDEIRPKTSGKQVTMPEKPSFEVTKSSTTSGTANTYVVVGWETERHDTGDCFDLTNNRFVAPVDGVYHFSFSFLLQDVANADDAIHVGIWKNGAHVNHYERAVGESATGYYGYNGYLPVQGSQTMKLSANDYIDIRFSSSGTVAVYAGNDWSTFSGFLVG